MVAPGSSWPSVSWSLAGRYDSSWHPGLLGEGWDCPAVNTLIDLTAATTSASTQQLRGRTMRLDPGWVDKVAHNWSVTCLLPSHPRLRSDPDLKRLRRKAEHLVVTGADR